MGFCAVWLSKILNNSCSVAIFNKNHTEFVFNLYAPSVESFVILSVHLNSIMIWIIKQLNYKSKDHNSIIHRKSKKKRFFLQFFNYENDCLFVYILNKLILYWTSRKVFKKHFDSLHLIWKNKIDFYQILSPITILFEFYNRQYDFLK